jgi:hypothetical protein
LMKNAMLDEIKIHIPRFRLKGFNLKTHYLYLDVYYPPRNNKRYRQYEKEIVALVKKYHKLCRKT